MPICLYVALRPCAITDVESHASIRQDEASVWLNAYLRVDIQQDEIHRGQRGDRSSVGLGEDSCDGDCGRIIISMWCEYRTRVARGLSKK